ncbi:glycerophosphodiester phosphodiesterase family protein [Gemmobacter serpentinus]|uniref:glycerophosphodiester phosphodiesterase family protein n=1 Tax=Gemmobacter serpentinus TaxID=2652247 RepID=UPI00124BFFAF|nr:glycerophosphodiester phosphodiesterase family protein [Gemmobacter serpentinus]
MQSPALPPAFLRLPLAHRALHDRAAGRPENSRAAIRAAVAAGYGIEIDIQLSADGAAMVFHDERLDRLTAETGWVKDRTAADLGAIRLLDAEDGIPTLAEVLEIVAGAVPLLIEVKDQTLTPDGRIGPLEAAIAKALTGYAGDVALMSFNPDAVAELARLCPATPRGITTGGYDYDGYAPLAPDLCDRLREIPDFDRTGASFISHEAADLSRPRVAALKSQGAHILCWTIRSAEAEATARQIAENITFEGYLPPLPA